jgi:hypothetical protein
MALARMPLLRGRIEAASATRTETCVNAPVADPPPPQSAAERLAAAADLESERARTEKAISAFASLADRLDPLAAERAKPWWRRWAD